MMYFTYKLNKQGDNIQPWCTPFPIWNQSVVPCPVLTEASWPAYRFLKRQVRWSDILISFRIFHSVEIIVIYTVKCFGIVNKAEMDVFLELSCFFDDPKHVGNLFSGSSTFVKPAWTSGSSLFTNCWRILSITLLACEMSAIVRQFEHSLALPFLGLEWKLTFSILVATAEFSKFADILSAALSQHHLLGIEKAQLKFHHLH